MKERWKKFLWSPAFWATIGVFGCVTGLYFQASPTTAPACGAWALMFLGAAYIEKNP